jgi:hypothetical protein
LPANALAAMPGEQATRTGKRCVLANHLGSRGDNMKKLLAAAFAALFATVTVGVTMLPDVAQAAEKKKDEKKKDKKKKDDMKKDDMKK